MSNTTIYNMDVLEGLAKLPSDSVDCIVTSPPYWGLRNYGLENDTVWDDSHLTAFGNPCEHDWHTYHKGRGGGDPVESTKVGNNKKIMHFSYDSNQCAKCGAWKGQLGLEPEFNLYVKHLFDIFNEAKRVLKPTGTFWLNIADTYASGGGQATEQSWVRENGGTQDHPDNPAKAKLRATMGKCRLMIPERISMKMVDEGGWILRNDIVWDKPNHMPESMDDRLSRCWEHIYFFVKEKEYYFNLDGIREKHSTTTTERYIYTFSNHSLNAANTTQAKTKHDIAVGREGAYSDPLHTKPLNPKGKNPGDIWRITTKALKEAHYAAFPPELPERCIKAGCPKGGIVLDPFAGSGTTLQRAKRLGMEGIGIEINPKYVDIIKKRLHAKELLNREEFRVINNSNK